MFGLSMHGCASRDINNHAEAVAFYESCKIKRGHDYGDERPIRGKEGSKSMSVRIYQGAVKFRYHNTDVVVWRPDDSYEIEAWSSASTCTFANRFLPEGHYLTRETKVLFDGGVYHPVLRGIRRHKDGTTEAQDKPVFRIQRIDKAAAKAVLAKTRYAEYRDWYKVMWPMVRDNGRGYIHFTPLEVLGHLSDENLWHDLIISSNASSPDDIREVLYSYFRPYTHETQKTLPRDVNYTRWDVVDDC